MQGCSSACQFLPGWKCQQPGSPGGDFADVEGPFAIPGPGGTTLTDAQGVPQGWGAVPALYNFSCWCANPAGTYANETLNCVAEPCPYPGRCVDRTVPNNGTACGIGSEGVACVRCSLQYYRYRDECRPCPKSQYAVVLLGVGVGVFLLYVGPKLSKLTSPQAVALLRSLVMYLQVRAARGRVPRPLPLPRLRC